MGVGRDELPTVGLLVPQANPTVESEMRVLLPSSYRIVATRMTSDRPKVEQRVVGYSHGMETWLATFAGLPLTAAAYACTASAYLLGPAREQAAADEAARRGHPVVTAFTAVRRMLAALGARHLRIVSPYPNGIHQACGQAWREAGFDVTLTRVERLNRSGGQAHPIYSINEADVVGTLESVGNQPADAIVLAGTGMPTLNAIAMVQPLDAPVVSSNLCLAWALSTAVRDSEQSQTDTEKWVGPAASWHANVTTGG